MDITWYGHACFRLKGRQGTVITDPYDKSLGLTLPKTKADIVTISHTHPHHSAIDGVKGDDLHTVDRPGEYEIRDIFVTGLDMRPDGADAYNNVFVIVVDDVTCCHLGDINHVPNRQQVDDMGNIDVLLIPVGGHQSLNATQASEVISLIEPYIVVPMHYQLPELTIELDPLEKFLKEMGVSQNEPVETLKITPSSLPEETQIVTMQVKQ